MEPLKQVQVEGQLMFAEPQDLFGNLDEVCSVKRLTVAGDSSVLILTITFKLNDIYFSTDNYLQQVYASSSRYYPVL